MDTMHELLMEQLRDLYDAEHQLRQSGISEMREKASDEDLKLIFAEHLDETDEQILRLEECFEIIEQAPTRETCKGMQGLLAEAREHLGKHPSGEVRDMAIIASAARIEHYEIAAYTVAIELAERMDLSEVAGLLEESLAEEERAADNVLDFADEGFFERLSDRLTGEATA